MSTSTGVFSETPESTLTHRAVRSSVKLAYSLSDLISPSHGVASESSSVLSAAATSSSSNSSIKSLIEGIDERNTQTTGPLASLFDGSNDQGVPLLIEVLALWGLALLVWLFVKVVWRLPAFKALVRPRDQDDKYRVTATVPIPLRFIGAPLFTFGSIGNSSWVQSHADQIPDMSLDSICFMLFIRCCTQCLAIWSVAAIFLILVDLNSNYQKNGTLNATAVLGTLSNSTTLNSTAIDKASVRDGILDFATVQFVDGGTLFWHVGVVYWNVLTTLLVLWQYWRVAVYLRTEYLAGQGKAELQRRCIILIGKDANRSLPSLECLPGESGADYRALKSVIKKNEQGVKAIEAGLQVVAENAKANSEQIDSASLKAIGVIEREIDAINKNKNYQYWRSPSRSSGYTVNIFETAEQARNQFRDLTRGKGKVKKSNIIFEPNDSDVCWKHLCHKSTTATGRVYQTFRHTAISIGLPLICLGYLIVIIGLSLLSNLSVWQTLWPWVGHLTQSDIGSIFLSFLTDIVPPVAVALCRLLMPSMITRVGNARRPVTYSKGDRDIVAWLFFALVLANLIFFTSASVFFQLYVDALSKAKLKDAIRDAMEAQDQVVQSYLAASRFWLTWYPSTVLSSTLAHMQFVRFFKKVWAKIRNRRDITLREQRECDAPDPSYPMGDRGSNFLLMIAVASAYAPLAGTVTIVAAFGVLFESLLITSEMYHLYKNEADAGGSIFGVLSNRLLFCIGVLQPAIASIVLGLKLSWQAGVCLIPIPLIVLAFHQELHHARLTGFINHTSLVEQFRYGSSSVLSTDVEKRGSFDENSGSLEKPGTLVGSLSEKTLSTKPEPFSYMTRQGSNASLFEKIGSFSFLTRKGSNASGTMYFPPSTVGSLLKLDGTTIDGKRKSLLLGLLQQRWIEPTVKIEVANAIYAVLSRPGSAPRYSGLLAKLQNTLIVDIEGRSPVEKDPLAFVDSHGERTKLLCSCKSYVGILDGLTSTSQNDATVQNSDEAKMGLIGKLFCNNDLYSTRL